MQLSLKQKSESEVYSSNSNHESLTRQLLISAALNEAEMVCSLVTILKISPDATRSGKPTALCYASLHGNFELMSFLLIQGANVHHRDALGLTPLHYAVRSDCAKSLTLLLDHGADVSVKSIFNRNVIDLADLYNASASSLEALKNAFCRPAHSLFVV